jgi:SAM-dependent methyltransferase
MGQQAKLESILNLLHCPSTGQELVIEQGALATSDRNQIYRVSESGIPLFAEEFCSPEAQVQRSHYDRVASSYLANLQYSHTIEYTADLDRALLDLVRESDLGTIGEICCGRGEAMQLVGARAGLGIGVDVSQNMLEAGLADHAGRPNIVFLQGDATQLPLAANIFDSVFVLGGVHHVNDRRALFAEIYRVLKPGGRFFFREPCSDFFLWRALRAVVYRLSPALDYATERPLRIEETVPVLSAVGFVPQIYERHGFLGFCLFMNSDVLVFNRLFRFVPGIRAITRVAARFDEWFVHLPAMGRVGLQVVGCAVKPR